MKKFLLSFFAIFLMIGLYSCQEGNEVVTTNDSGDNGEIIFELPDFDNLSSQIKNATLETDIVLITPEDENYIQSGKKKDQLQCGDGHGGHKNNPAYYLIKKLKLTKDQKKEVRSFIKDYKKCVREAKKWLRQQEKALVKEACLKIKEVRKKLKNGEITRCQAKKMICQICKELRKALKALSIKEELKECVCTLFQSILDILDDDQKDVFFEWMDAHPRFDFCEFDDDDNPPFPPTF